MAAKELKEDQQGDSAQLVYVGVDDGHFGTKVCLESGECFYRASRVARGLQAAGFGDDRQDTAYEISGEHFTVVENTPLIAAEDPRYVIPAYPINPINRVLVHHSLMSAGLGGKEVAIVTGLPIEEYYVPGTNNKNSDLIDKKMAHLLSADIKNVNPTVHLAKIAKHNVVSEGIAAFFDMALNLDGSENQETSKLIADRAMAIVDVGGKTTDIALVMENGRGLYGTRSGTAALGALNLTEEVGAQLQLRFKLNSVPPAKHIEQAIKTKVYSLYGQEHDVSDIVNQVASSLASKIIGFMRKKIGEGHDIGSVAYVGGGTIDLSEHFRKIYTGLSIFPERPEFANARGAMKVAKYIHAGK